MTHSSCPGRIWTPLAPHALMQKVARNTFVEEVFLMLPFHFARAFPICPRSDTTTCPSKEATRWLIATSTFCVAGSTGTANRTKVVARESPSIRDIYKDLFTSKNGRGWRHSSIPTLTHRPLRHAHLSPKSITRKGGGGAPSPPAFRPHTARCLTCEIVPPFPFSGGAEGVSGTCRTHFKRPLAPTRNEFRVSSFLS